MGGDELRGRTALVTGASSGIGLEFCRQLARQGCNLLMVSNEEVALNERAAEIRGAHPGLRVETMCLDLTGKECVGEIEKFMESHDMERVDVLINNAGIFSFDMLCDTKVGKVNAFIDLHVRAVTLLCQWMARRMEAQGGGWILNMSSMSCWMPMPGLGMYSSTKAYIRVLSRAMHYEMRDAGVRVCVACPGGIATDLFGLPPKLQRLAVRLGVLDTPESFARKALKRMLRGKQQYINGLLNRVSILAVGMTPRWVRMQVKYRLLDKGIKR